MAEPFKKFGDGKSDREGKNTPASELLERIPPQDLEAERCVIGSILADVDVIDDVMQHIQPHHFYSDAHRQMYETIHAMYENGIRGIDAVTLGHELDRKGVLAEIGGPSTILAVMQAVPHAAHAEYYAKIVREKFMQRSLINACTESLREAYYGRDAAEEIVARAEQRVYNIAEDQGGLERIGIGEILNLTFERIFHRMDQEGAISGIPTGFHGLDDVTSGFQPSELLILAARPAMGKTALVCNFALAVAESGTGALLFSLEQSRLELAERLLCIYAKLDGHKLRQGELDDVEQHALMEGANAMRELKLFIDDTAGRTMSQIAAIARRLKRRHGLGIVIIDYLQLIEPEDKNQPREQQISSITRRLKFLAKDLDIPVIALAQLNRGVEQREDKRPRLADLRESGAIEQDADIVMFLHRPEAYDPEDRPGEADLIVAKNRHGPIGTVQLVWLRQMMKFGDRAPVNIGGDGF
ncbi:MAG: replicative DNA helicase [Planctomycetaceae bacterium]